LANEVKINPFGFVFVPLDIKLMNSPILKSVDYKVDTGANRTTISSRQLNEFRYDNNLIKMGNLLDGYARPTLASGMSVDDCYEIVLPEIRIGEWVGYNWPFMTSLSVPFRFLLGTDSMQFFNWQFDYENGVCKFDLIPSKRKLLFNQMEQSIHSLDGFE
jgi:hypothetical protein